MTDAGAEPTAIARADRAGGCPMMTRCSGFLRLWIK